MTYHHILIILLSIAIFLLGLHMLLRPEEEYQETLKNYEYRTELNKNSIFESISWSNLKDWKKRKTYWKNFIRLMGILFMLFAILISRAN